MDALCDHYVQRSYLFQTLRWHIFDADHPPFVLFVSNVTAAQLQALGVASIKVAAVGAGAVQFAGGADRWVCVRADGALLSDDLLFERLCRRCACAHWAQWTGPRHGLVWRSSRGAVGDLRQFASRRLAPLPTLRSELNLAATERAVIVAGEFGSGRSHLMRSVSARLSAEGPLDRVIYIELRHGLSELEGPCASVADAVAAVARLAGVRDEASRAEFAARIIRGCPGVAIFFDGFDEVDGEGQALVLRLLEALKAGTRAQLWVTTRFGQHASLESALDTLALGLEPLTKRQKEALVQAHWRHRLKALLASGVPEKLREHVRGALKEMELCLATLPQKRRRTAAVLALMAELSQLVSAVIRAQGGVESVRGDDTELARGGGDNALDVEECERDCDGSGQDEKESARGAEEMLRGGGSSGGSGAAPTLCEQIDRLDFSGFVKVLLSVEKCLSAEDNSQYAPTPLNLFLLAEMTFCAQFRLPFVANINEIYEKFLEVNYVHYHKKRDKIVHVNTMYSSPEYFAHKSIALELFLPEESSTILLSYDKVDRELLEGMGVVAPRDGGFHYCHHSFAEYFFCEWLVTELSVEDACKVLASRVLLGPNYAAVRKFLNLQIENSQVSIAFLSKPFEECNIFGFHNTAGTFLHLLTEECLGSIMILFLETFPEDASNMILRTNSNLQNVLHVACDLGYNRIIDIVLNFVRKHLSRKKTERLILQKDIWDESPFECLYVKSHLVLFIDFLHDSNDKIDGELCSYLLEVNLRDSETTILTKHLIMEHPDTFDKLVEVAFSTLSRYLFLQLVVNQIDLHGSTCLHNLAFCGTENSIALFWHCAVKAFDDHALLRDYLLRRNARGNTVIHESALGNNGPAFRLLINNAKLLKGDALKAMLMAVNAHGSTALHEAVSNSSEEFVHLLLNAVHNGLSHEDADALLESTDRSLDTVLHLAARRGDAAGVLEQLCAQAAPNADRLRRLLSARNGRGCSAMHAAVEGGSIEAVRKLWSLLCASADNEERASILAESNKFGDTVFHAATTRAETQVLQALLECTSPGDVQRILALDNANGDTVLHQAAANGAADAAVLWLRYAGDAAGAALARANGEGECALHVAVKTGEPRTVRVLMQVGDVEATDLRGNTLLHVAVSRTREDVLDVVLNEMRRLLPQARVAALVERTNANGDTALHLAVAAAPTALLERLLHTAADLLGEARHKALLMAVDGRGRSALQVALDRGDLVAAARLLREARDKLSEDALLEVVSRVNCFGETVLHAAVALDAEGAAVEWCSEVRLVLPPAVFALLLAAPNRSGDTVLHHVVRLHKVPAPALIYWMRVARDCLGSDGLSELIRRRNGAGDTLLHLASSAADAQAARLLCSRNGAFGAADTLRWMLVQANGRGEAPLHVVARKGDAAALGAWLRLVRDELGDAFLAQLFPLTTVGAGESVLHLAALRGDAEVVRQLCAVATDVLGRGAGMEEFLTAETRSGASALHLAVGVGDVLVVRELWERAESMGVSLKLLLRTDDAGDTLLHTATARGHAPALNQTCVFMKARLSSASAREAMLRRNCDGRAAVHVAVFKKRLDLLTRLADWYCELTDDDQELLLSTTASGHSLLHVAVGRGDARFLDRLLTWFSSRLGAAGRQTLLLMADGRGRSVLHDGAKEGEPALLSALLEWARVELDPKKLRGLLAQEDEVGDTVLHDVARRTDPVVFNLLCEVCSQAIGTEATQALLKRTNRKGSSAMDEAVASGKSYRMKEQCVREEAAPAGVECANGRSVEFARRRAARRKHDCLAS
ncbi:uncharacterized protein LOC124168117 [Ischnura elegans]|uniref:uncharacterized protein LOC124168117 n=1 Tax=Ischnura elegans TaxID=197161 RepID=UPI001ED8BA43|nr:uncharacterized protein LOC124168117 [Ischnura elegans]XP_046402192.1 uncharacterized protein LOC124168117 [Ischnura elegans]